MKRPDRSFEDASPIARALSTAGIRIPIMALMFAALFGSASLALNASAKKIFSPDAADLGNLKEGEYYPFKIELKNVSGKTVRVREYESSCGCTLINGPVGDVAPGGSIVLLGEMNTSAKIGKVVKVIDVHTDASVEPFAIVLYAFVEHDPTSGSDTSELFRGKCASCHAPLGSRSLSGKDLYESACALCHKEVPQSFAAKDREGLSDIIGNGLANTSMPGFSEAKGGPLTSAQIESLAEFLVHDNGLK